MQNRILSLITLLITAALIGSALLTPSLSQGALPLRCELAFSGRTTWSAFEVGQAPADQKMTLSILKGLALKAESEKTGASSFLISPQESSFLLADTDLPLYGQTLREVSQKLAEGMLRPETRLLNAKEQFTAALRDVLLKKGLNDELIQPRVNSILKNRVTDWRRALGDLSIEDTRVLFYGKNLAHPSPTSLVGRYIKETGAQSKIMRLDYYPDSGLSDGPEKLVIAISEASFQKFHDLLLTNSNFMTIVGHAAVIRGGSFTDVWGDRKAVRIGKMNEPFPFLLLKSSEAQRMNRYLDLAISEGHKGWHSMLKQPWKIEGYCATGGYSCCTHWIGNMPIGDKMVNEYAFPPDMEGPGPFFPQIQTLKPFTVNASNQAVAKIWKVPGHQQLADVIGQHQSNITGDMANPGWLIHTLMNRTATERVPLVFLVTADHTAPIPEKPAFKYEHRH